MAAEGKRLRLTKDGKIFFKGTKTYGNGDFYEGEFVDAMRHGVGKLKFQNGDRYQGEFERNSFHGFGVFVWNTVIADDNSIITGRKYEGEWKDGKKHGKGIYHNGLGDVYSGMFANDYYDGEGTLKMASGDIYEGSFVRGRPSGKIRIRYCNGNVYEGGTMGGLFEGQGKLVYAEGMGSYDGGWHNGKEHGKGVKIYSDTARYVGDFVEGAKEGDGMMFFANGDQYHGGWKAGHMEGKGVYQYRNGDLYEGDFVHGFRYGTGKLMYRDGGYYHGEFRNVQTSVFSSNPQPLPLCDGKRHGTGIRVWTSGAKYEGQWDEDRIHGSGSLLTADGGKYEGGFFNGLRNGKGVENIGNMLGNSFICPIGNKHFGIGFCTYSGEFCRGLFHGDGEILCMSGQYYRGKWKQGKKHGEGEQYFIRNGEIGDVDRRCIGGVDFLYRVKLYQGSYEDDFREGSGVITYTNGDTLAGHFQRGQPHGTMVYTFAISKTTKMAKYVRGERIEWIELKRWNMLNTNNRLHGMRRVSVSSSGGIDDQNGNLHKAKVRDKSKPGLLKEKSKTTKQQAHKSNSVALSTVTELS